MDSHAPTPAERRLQERLRELGAAARDPSKYPGFRSESERACENAHRWLQKEHAGEVPDPETVADRLSAAQRSRPL